MTHFRTALLALASVAAFTVRAGELTPEVEAKFLKVIVSSSGGNKIACSDPALKTALEAQGIQVDASASIVWATNAAEGKTSKAMGRLVISGKRELSFLASVLLEEEGGRPKILLNPANLHAATRVTLGDAILKIAEKI